jgi:hypothetical protein
MSAIGTKQTFQHVGIYVGVVTLTATTRAFSRPIS